MYYLDENMVQVWIEEEKGVILLLNHTWREKEEIEKSGFKLYFVEVSQEQLELLKTLRTITSETDYIKCIEEIGARFFEKLIRYKYVTNSPTVSDNKKVWHSQVGEYLHIYLKARYGIDYPERPSRVLLLPTLRCNGNCIFCITNSKIEVKEDELSVGEWEEIVKRVCTELHPCSVDIVGGEPLMRMDVSFAIAKVLVEHNILVKLITNGVALANEKIVEKFSNILKEKKHNIQISLDGDATTHNYIRPNVSYDEVIKAISNISNFGLTFGINLTVNKLNLGKIEEVVRAIMKYNPSYILFGPLQISPKNVELCHDIMIAEEDENNLRLLVNKLKNEFKDVLMKYDKEEPVYHTDTIALGTGKKLHRCTGYIEEMTIVPNGKIVSCLRGTAFKELYGENIKDYNKNLKYLWKNSKQAKKFRSIPVRGKCVDCEYNQQCNMGCPLETYILENVLGGYNPHCRFIPNKQRRN